MITTPVHYKVRIWDLPTRLFHWLLVTSFILAWLTQGDDRYLDFHVFAGYLMLGLLGFRLVWGLIGSYYARFHYFAFGSKAVWQYLASLLARQPQHFVGHNPAGSWAIWFILGLGFLVGITGLLTLGGEEQHGIFAGIIGFAWGEILRQWHEIIAWMMLGMVGIHLAGVIVSSWLHRENLIKAMITGYKTIPITNPQEVLLHFSTAVLLSLAVIIGSISYFRGYWLQTLEQPYLPFVGPKLPDNALWRQECGDCHLAYHPTLLPARSWQRMLAEQHEHFEEDLDLPADTLAEIQTFLVTNAAESALTEPAWKINRTVPPNQAPLQITKTAYWKEQHREIPNEVWQHPQVKSRGNCAACHLDAKQGTFEDGAMRLPN
jgi:cytochrome b